MPSSRHKDRVYRVVIGAAIGVFKLLGLKFTLTGTEHIPRTGGAILVSNHISYLDFTFIGLAAKQQKRFVRFMAKKSVFDNRVSGPFMRGMHHIPVDRLKGAASYDEALQALRDGELVGIFPEATISGSFMLKDFKSGVVRMAIDAQVPLIPMVTWGGHRVATKGGRRSLKRGKAITVAIGDPIPPTDRRQIRALMTSLRETMDKLLDEAQHSYPQSPSGPDDTWWVPASMGGTAPTIEEARARDATDAAGRRGLHLPHIPLPHIPRPHLPGHKPPPPDPDPTP